jgi:hypothetical protein
MSWKKNKQQTNGIDVPDGLQVQYQETPLFPVAILDAGIRPYAAATHFRGRSAPI